MDAVIEGNILRAVGIDDRVRRHAHREDANAEHN